jgi:hypothetical protein
VIAGIHSHGCAVSKGHGIGLRCRLIAAKPRPQPVIPGEVRIVPTPLARGLVRKTVDVVNYPDGRFAVLVEPGEIVENMRLGAALAMVMQRQDTYEPHRSPLSPGAAAASQQPGSTEQPTKGRLHAKSRLRWRQSVVAAAEP